LLTCRGIDLYDIWLFNFFSLNDYFIYNVLFRFVSSVLPPGGEELKGDEVDRIVAFKNSLGIDDPDAAAMHMEVFFCLLLWRLCYCES